MTAQEQGMLLVAAAVRSIVPPRLEALIIVYDPTKPDGISSVMATTADIKTAADNLKAFGRSRIAAKAYVEKPANGPGFVSRS